MSVTTSRALEHGGRVQRRAVRQRAPRLDRTRNDQRRVDSEADACQCVRLLNLNKPSTRKNAAVMPAVRALSPETMLQKWNKSSDRGRQISAIVKNDWCWLPQSTS